MFHLIVGDTIPFIAVEGHNCVFFKQPPETWDITGQMLIKKHYKLRLK